MQLLQLAEKGEKNKKYNKNSHTDNIFIELDYLL